MSVATYGEHAERAAHALNWLLRHDAAPIDPAAVEQSLHCREAVLDALRQRLFGFGLDARVRLDHPPTPPAGINLEGVDYKLATLIENIASATPRLPLEQRLVPTDVLGRRSVDPIAESWRTAAIESLAASHVLDLASDKPWLREPGAGWFLLSDLAVAMEAVLVLDARLSEVGLLNQHDAPTYPMGLEEKRLVTSQTARVATWFATTDAPDHAVLRPPGAPRTNVAFPVSIVSAPEDLAAGQQRLAGFLRPLAIGESGYLGEPEISADSARQVTASQLFLVRRFGGMARLNRKTHDLVEFFETRAEVLTALQPLLRYLIDVVPGEPNMRRFWQQSELTAAITRMEDRGMELELQPRQMLALANATHEVTHNMGACLHRELLRSNTNLRNAHPRLDRPVRVGRRSRLEATVTDLVHLPAPSSPVATYSSPMQRAALRQTLEITPTAARPPLPYPATRSRNADHLRP